MISIMVLVIVAFSSAAIPAHALIAVNNLNIAGSSTVLPIAIEASATFPTYWNSLVAANPSWGTPAALDISSMNIQGLGSGTAFPAILPASGNPTADIGEMSRPPTVAEWGQSNAGNVQIWAIGIDSIANVYSPDMTWAPTDLTAKQVAQLFESTDAAGQDPIYTTWGQFLTAYYGSVSAIPTAAQTHMSDPIFRIIRDPTSGTYDCWNNFFGEQLGHSAETTNAQGAVTGSQYMAPYTILNAQETYAEALASSHDSIAFVPMPIALEYSTSMISVNIYNASPPTGSAGYFAPSQLDVIAGTYTPYRWLWEVTPSTIPTTGPNLAEGVWIAYLKADAGTAGSNPNFVTDNNYMAMPRAAMAGGQVLNSALGNYSPLAGQTQTVPRLVVDANDFFYFTDAYIAYYTNHVYNPYADITAQGTINCGSFLAFLSYYVHYFTTYAPTN